MIDISTLRAMAAAGASVDVILAAVEAELVAEGERVQARRSKDAARKRRSRHADDPPVAAGHAESQSVTRSHADTEVSLTSLLSSSVSTTKKEESKKERARKSQLPAEWKPTQAHYAKAKKFGFPESYVDQKAEDLRNWAKSKAIIRADWDATFHGFIKPNEARNGFGGPRPLQDDSKSISRAALRLAEKAERGEFTFGPRPSLLPSDDPRPVQLLSKR